jgi:zinc-ribbon domain
MKCTACGNENQPGAKFCVHCGVVLSAATPAYVPTPSSAAVQTGPRPVVPTAPSTPAAAVQTGTRPVTPAAPPAAPAPSVSAPPVATSASAPAAMVPASAGPAASSRTMGMAVAAIAALVVLVGGGYFGYRMFAGEGSKQATAAVESPKAEAPSAEVPKGAAATAPAAEGQTANAGAAGPAGAPAGVAASSTAAPGAASTDTSALPGQPAVAEDKAAQAKAAKAQAKATTSATSPGAGAPTSTTPTPGPSQPAPAKPPAKTNVAQAAPQDRWQAYADEMTRCAKEDFFSRVVCQQKVRGRYCEGYWGKVPQCPGNSAVDHGQ